MARSSTVSRRRRQQFVRFARQLDADLTAPEPLALTTLVSWWLVFGLSLQALGGLPGRPLARARPGGQRTRAVDIDAVPAFAGGVPDQTDLSRAVAAYVRALDARPGA